MIFRKTSCMVSEGSFYVIINGWMTNIFILVIAYFTPVKEVVNVMLIFWGVDLVSGIWASMKRKERFKSSKLRRSIYKFIWYTVAIMCAYMMERTFHMGWSNLANIIGGFICFVELKSIFENVTEITEEPVFVRIFKIFKKKGSETIGEILDDDEKEK